MNIAVIICIALLAVIALLCCVILEKAKELCEYGLRIAYGLTTISRQMDTLIGGQNSLSDGLCYLRDLVIEYTAENSAGENPDIPDEADGRSAAAIAAEKAFTEGVLNVLNYGGAPGKEGRA